MFQGSMLVHFKRAAPSLDHLIRPYIRPSVRLYVQYYIWLAQCPSLPGALAHTLPLSLLCRGRSAYDKTLLVPSRHHLSQEPGRGWHSFINVKNNYLSLLSLRLIYYYSTFKLEFQNSEMVENEVMLAVFYMNILFSILHLPLTFVPGVGEVLNKQFLLFTIKALESLSCKNSESNLKKNFLVQNIYKNWNVF